MEEEFNFTRKDLIKLIKDYTYEEDHENTEKIPAYVDGFLNAHFGPLEQ